MPEIPAHTRDAYAHPRKGLLSWPYIAIIEQSEKIQSIRYTPLLSSSSYLFFIFPSVTRIHSQKRPNSDTCMRSVCLARWTELLRVPLDPSISPSLSLSFCPPPFDAHDLCCAICGLVFVIFVVFYVHIFAAFRRSFISHCPFCFDWEKLAQQFTYT